MSRVRCSDCDKGRMAEETNVDAFSGLNVAIERERDFRVEFIVCNNSPALPQCENVLRCFPCLYF